MFARLCDLAGTPCPTTIHMEDEVLGVKGGRICQGILLPYIENCGIVNQEEAKAAYCEGRGGEEEEDIKRKSR